ncbi:MAG: outer membrane protein assembly factor BamA [Sphingomonas sp.]|uniref:outer membrane protein assembly factor BamA n=1 Tax=Sphingomonas sp. TaxID=28214 RepID=UPI0025DCA5ED|nr:outer membrane protein assembly factor BamA [Sphingomonas sp.]MBX9858148.1 outer membrane protein assembly factor BamA [Sphingomonas sp.]MBY0284037.1 outer membrane protein assembly factor BamA [Sphingomonas sp.]
MASTILAGLPMAAVAQTAAPTSPPAVDPVAQAAPAAAPAPAPVKVIRTLRVEGSQRIEPETVLSYTKLRVSANFTNETLDQAIKDLLASELFADVTIDGAVTGDIVVRVRENPIINRVLLEGNKRLKADKITKEIKLAPRQIFTRTAVRQDVARIIELYRRQGRFAASVAPKMVSLDQNRVDIIFEISEGPKSKVRQINIIGNEVFNDAKVRAQMATKQASLLTTLSSNTSYDQDRLAFDQQKLRQFYLTQGYADFKVTSAVAELTPDKKDFIITYVVEEGKRYRFGEITVDSEIRDFDNKKLAASLVAKKGEWYNAKKIEDSVDAINQTAGLFGYAFAEVNPEFDRDAEKLLLSINFHIAQAQRTYVERIDINGNTLTKDKVIRREIRVSEGDAFNTFLVKRSQDRINSLGFFQEKLEVQQKPGSAPDRVVLETNVEEKATGELNLSIGYSSLEQFIVQGSVRQRNFRGLGQELRASAQFSTFSKQVELGFSEPYLFDKNIGLAVDLFRRDLNNFNFVGTIRQTNYTQVSTGFQVRTSIPLTEYWSVSARYGLTYDQVGLDPTRFFTNGACDPLLAGRYLCDQIGNRLTSALGVSLLYDSLNSRIRPTAGQRLVVSGDLAGLGGDVRYIRGRFEGKKFWNVGSGFIFSAGLEGGYIQPLEGSRGPGIDAVRINDRFYLGEPQFRGFNIRGVGPRVQRLMYQTDANGVQTLNDARNQFADDALGGRAYYLGRLELELPLGAGARELGLRPSIYIDFGALFGVLRPLPTAVFPTTTVTLADGSVVNRVLPLPLRDPATNQIVYVVSDGGANAGLQTICPTGFATTSNLADCTGSSINSTVDGTQPFLERFVGNSASPRLSVGIGVNWNSPFGPLRIDLAQALLRQFGEDTKLITFNVGTQF